MVPGDYFFRAGQAVAAYASMYAYELRARSGKIEAGVKILAEEIEFAAREDAQ